MKMRCCVFVLVEAMIMAIIIGIMLAIAYPATTSDPAFEQAVTSKGTEP